MNRKKQKNDNVDSKDQPEPSSQAEPQGGDDQPSVESGVHEESLSPQQEVDQLKQQLQRVAADYQNFQKRSSRQIEQAGQFARQALAKDFLAVLDSFEHTFSGCDENQDAGDVIKGVRIIYDQLLNILSGHCVKPIEVHPGDPFDPTLHEAMLRQESGEFEQNAVITELARGYTMNGITLRPAKVSVARTATVESEITDFAESESDQKQSDQEVNDADV